MSSFRKATKEQSRLRAAFIGPAGAGKTYSALAVATHLGKSIAVIDSERGSASKYADEFSFDVAELESFSPDNYCDLIIAAGKSYDVVVVDSLSHAWSGKDGALELVDKAKQRQKIENGYTAWRDITPKHNRLVDTILTSPAHIICTMRSKMEYVQEKVDGRTVIRKVGLQPIQREGMEFEFDLVGDLDTEHRLVIGKTRCRRLDQKVFQNPGREVADILREWLSSGAVPMEKPAAVVVEPEFRAPAVQVNLDELAATWATRINAAADPGELSGMTAGITAAGLAKHPVVRSAYTARAKQLGQVAKSA